ncbi:MAG TPA: hypothetical protein VFZ53_20545 [Polyangiaceae bacterium]
MTRYYVFNGDADGLCALQQLRLGDPTEATLVTGVKRDIALVERVSAAPGDECTVLDVSLDVNRKGLVRALEAGAKVRYFDHHHAGEIPPHPGLEAHIDTSATVCTSLLVDRYLEGKHRAWAITGAFGDSLTEVATALADSAGLSSDSALLLKKLGVSLNYNAYGETVDDLHVPPARLAEEMKGFADPLEFAHGSETYHVLRAGYEDDMHNARELAPAREVPGALVFVLPDLAWARRASGVFANEIARAHATSAVAIVTVKASGDYLVSLRVPNGASVAADEFCRRFPSGGGRKTAGGINHLPRPELDPFIDQFEHAYRT